MQKPAEQLVSSIERQIKRYGGAKFGRVISVRTLKRWLSLAKSIDARFRLDGSQRSKRPKRSTFGVDDDAHLARAQVLERNPAKL